MEPELLSAEPPPQVPLRAEKWCFTMGMGNACMCNLERAAEDEGFSAMMVVCGAVLGWPHDTRRQRLSTHGHTQGWHTPLGDGPAKLTEPLEEWTSCEKRLWHDPPLPAGQAAAQEEPGRARAHAG